MPASTCAPIARPLFPAVTRFPPAGETDSVARGTHRAHGTKARLAVAEVLRMHVEDVAVRDRPRLCAIGSSDGLAGGGRWIRTLGPRHERAGFCCGRRIAGPTGAAKKGCFLCGTDGSNPSPSSRESVSRPHPRSRVENPGFPRGCARLAWRRGRQRRAGLSNSRQTAAIFQYRRAADVVGENATPIPTKLGLPRFNVRQIFEFGSGSGKAEHGALIVPRERQTGG